MVAGRPPLARTRASGRSERGTEAGMRMASAEGPRPTCIHQHVPMFGNPQPGRTIMVSPTNGVQAGSISDRSAAVNDGKGIVRTTASTFRYCSCVNERWCRRGQGRGREEDNNQSAAQRLRGPAGGLQHTCAPRKLASRQSSSSRTHSQSRSLSFRTLKPPSI